MIDRMEVVHQHDWKEACLVGTDITFWMCPSCGATSPGPTDNEALRPVPIVVHRDTPCAVCGRVGTLPLVPVAVVVPVMARGGVALRVPGVYPLCASCRRAVAYAERGKHS